MPEDQPPHHRIDPAPARSRAFVSPPVHRGSTMLHVDTADRLHDGSRLYQQAETYAVYGNATHHALENVLAGIEGGTRCQITSSGQSAATTALLAYLQAGDHCLVPDSVYGSTREFFDSLLGRLGIDTEYYDPALEAVGLAPLFRPNTTVLYLESPGSHTFEVQDVPALAALAHERGAKVGLGLTRFGGHPETFARGVSDAQDASAIFT